MLETIKKYFIATRPWSFTMSLISVSVGTLLAAEEGSISWIWFALTAVGIMTFHAAANLINDYCDTRYGVDQEDSPTAKYRPQPLISGMLTPRQLLMETAVMLVITITIGAAAAFFRSWHVLWIGIIGVLTCVFYTAGPVKFKYRALGEFAVFMMWGPLMIEGAYAVQRGDSPARLCSFPFPSASSSPSSFSPTTCGTLPMTPARTSRPSALCWAAAGATCFRGMIVLSYAYVLGMIAAGVMSFWGLLIFLSVPKAISLLKTFREKIPDMADALTAQFDTVFGILLLLAILLDTRVVL